MARIQPSDFKNCKARTLLLSFVVECLRSANQPIHAGLYEAHVCIFLVLTEIEMLLFYDHGESFLMCSVVKLCCTIRAVFI